MLMLYHGTGRNEYCQLCVFYFNSKKVLYKVAHINDEKIILMFSLINIFELTILFAFLFHFTEFDKSFLIDLHCVTPALKLFVLNLY